MDLQETSMEESEQADAVQLLYQLAFRTAQKRRPNLTSEQFDDAIRFRSDFYRVEKYEPHTNQELGHDLDESLNILEQKPAA